MQSNTINATTNPRLLLDENRGIHIYKALVELANEYGYPETWDETCEDSEFQSDDAIVWLNENVCEGCTVEWYEGGIWAIPDGYQMTEGCFVSPMGEYI